MNEQENMVRNDDGYVYIGDLVFDLSKHTAKEWRDFVCNSKQLTGLDLNGDRYFMEISSNHVVIISQYGGRKIYLFTSDEQRLEFQNCILIG